MLYLIFSILTSTAILVLFKVFSKFRINILQSIVFNYLIATVLGFSIQWDSYKPLQIFNENWIIYAVVIGSIFIFTFHIFAFSSQSAGVALTAISSKISVIIPVIAGAFLYKTETLNLLKIIGLFSALISFLLVFYSNDKLKINPRFIFLPVLCFLANGLNDTMMSFTQRKFAYSNTMIFVSAIFTFSLIIGVLILIIRYISIKEKVLLKNVIAGFILGIFNFLSTYFFFMSIPFFENSVFFPFLNTGIVISSALIGYFIFKEKLNIVNCLGIIIGICTIIVLTFAK